MGVAQCNIEKPTEGWNSIERGLMNQNASLDKKIYDEYEELKKKSNESQGNQKIKENIFLLTNVKKQYSRFIKWYRIAYYDPVTKESKKKQIENKYTIETKTTLLTSDSKKNSSNKVNSINLLKKEIEKDLNVPKRMEEKRRRSNIYNSIDHNVEISLNLQKINHMPYFEDIIDTDKDKKNDDRKSVNDKSILTTQKTFNNSHNHASKNLFSPIKSTKHKELKLSSSEIHSILKPCLTTKNTPNDIKHLKIKDDILENKNKSNDMLGKSKTAEDNPPSYHFQFQKEVELNISNQLIGKKATDFSKVVYKNLINFKKENPFKFNEKISKGPPQSLRWVLWMISAELPMEKIETNYLSYLHDEISADVDTQIKKDLNRTIQEDIINLENIQETQNSLYKVLKAFAANDRKIGYCQGMNFIAGFLLICSDFNELEVFYMLQALFSNTFSNHLGIRGFYIDKFPLLNFYLDLFDVFFEKYNPTLRKHFKQLGLPPDSWVSKWFLTLFTICMPIKVTMRIWDCIITVGLNFLIQFTLSLLKSIEAKLLAFEDEFDLIDFFKMMTPFSSNKDLELNLDEIIFSALKIKLDPVIIGKIQKEFESKNNCQIEYLKVKYHIRSFESFSVSSSSKFENMNISELSRDSERCNNSHGVFGARYSSTLQVEEIKDSNIKNIVKNIFNNNNSNKYIDMSQSIQEVNTQGFSIVDEISKQLEEEKLRNENANKETFILDNNANSKYKSYLSIVLEEKESTEHIEEVNSEGDENEGNISDDQVTEENTKVNLCKKSLDKKMSLYRATYVTSISNIKEK